MADSHIHKLRARAALNIYEPHEGWTRAVPKVFQGFSVAGFCAPGPARRHPAAPAPGRPTPGRHSATGPVEGNRSKVRKTRQASAGELRKLCCVLRPLAAQPPHQAHGRQVVPPPGDARCRMQDAGYTTPCSWTGLGGDAPLGGLGFEVVCLGVELLGAVVPVAARVGEVRLPGRVLGAAAAARLPRLYSFVSGLQFMSLWQ